MPLAHTHSAKARRAARYEALSYWYTILVLSRVSFWCMGRGFVLVQKMPEGSFWYMAGGSFWYTQYIPTILHRVTHKKDDEVPTDIVLK